MGRLSRSTGRGPVRALAGSTVTMARCTEPRIYLVTTSTNAARSTPMITRPVVGHCRLERSMGSRSRRTPPFRRATSSTTTSSTSTSSTAAASSGAQIAGSLRSGHGQRLGRTDSSGPALDDLVILAQGSELAHGAAVLGDAGTSRQLVGRDDGDPLIRLG